MTGWTQLQQSWNAPGTTTISRLEALGKFAGTNINNVLQLAMIFGGPEDDAAVIADDAVDQTVGDALKGLAEGPCSFTPATLVDTDHGEQAIGTLKVGEQVLAYNSKTRKMEDEPILHVWIHADNDLVDLTLTTKLHAPHSTVTTTTSEVIHTNKKHPFFTEEAGFVPVGQLKLGMHVLRADEYYGVITGYKLVPDAHYDTAHQIAA